MSRIVVSDPETGKAYQIEPNKSDFSKLVGKEIGEQIDGDDVGLPGYKLKIKGGSDEEGFPMRGDVQGEGRTKSLLREGPGYNPEKDGERRRKTVRGKKVSTDNGQLNVVVEESGDKSIEEILGLETDEEVEDTEEEDEEN